MRIKLLGVQIDQLRFAEVVERIKNLVRDGGWHYVVTANPEMVIEAQHNPVFLEIINQADLVTPDGVGLQAMAEYSAKRNAQSVYQDIWNFLQCWIGVPFKMKRAAILPERVSGADLVTTLVAYASDSQVPIILIGGAPGQAKGTKESMMKRYPSAQIQAFSGPSNADSETHEQFEDLISQIDRKRSSLIFVAFGHPKQELWIAKHLQELPQGVAIGVGGTFAYLSGAKRRSPVFLQNLGLEWLWRLALEPKRAKRIINASIVFPIKVYKQSKGR